MTRQRPFIPLLVSLVAAAQLLAALIAWGWFR